MRRIWTLIWVVFVFVALSACQSVQPDASSAEQQVVVGDLAFPKNRQGFADITVQDLATLLQEYPDVTVVNVHIPYAGNIPGTDLTIPYNTIGAQTDMLPDKESVIVLYCRSGAMSTQAAQTLVKLGYKNVLEVDGGMNAWTAAGFSLEQ
nr:rhodanese-like domain-containing protein [Ardenticatena sp.]